jgi:hypothetical protein
MNRFEKRPSHTKGLERRTRLSSRHSRTLAMGCGCYLLPEFECRLPTRFGVLMRKPNLEDRYPNLEQDSPLAIRLTHTPRYFQTGLLYYADQRRASRQLLPAFRLLPKLRTFPLRDWPCCPRDSEYVPRLSPRSSTPLLSEVGNGRRFWPKAKNNMQRSHRTSSRPPVFYYAQVARCRHSRVSDSIGGKGSS